VNRLLHLFTLLWVPATLQAAEPPSAYWTQDGGPVPIQQVPTDGFIHLGLLYHRGSCHLANGVDFLDVVVTPDGGGAAVPGTLAAHEHRDQRLNWVPSESLASDTTYAVTMRTTPELTEACGTNAGLDLAFTFTTGAGPSEEAPRPPFVEVIAQVDGETCEPLFINYSLHQPTSPYTVMTHTAPPNAQVIGNLDDALIIAAPEKPTCLEAVTTHLVSGLTTTRSFCTDDAILPYECTDTGCASAGAARGATLAGLLILCLLLHRRREEIP